MTDTRWAIYSTRWKKPYLYNDTISNMRRDAINQYCDDQHLPDGRYVGALDTTDQKVFWERELKRGDVRCVKVCITPVEEL